MLAVFVITAATTAKTLWQDPDSRWGDELLVIFCGGLTLGQLGHLLRRTRQRRAQGRRVA